MDLNRYVEDLRQQLLVTAEAGGDDARVLADRLSASLDAATRLVLLDALSTAADEITRELAPGSVDVRLRGRDAEFVVVVPASADAEPDTSAPDPRPAPVARPVPTDGEDTGTSRITLRLPEQLKLQIEDAAGRDGVSVNAWLVRAVTGAVGSPSTDHRPPRRNPASGQRLTGWAR